MGKLAVSQLHCVLLWVAPTVSTASTGQLTWTKLSPGGAAPEASSSHAAVLDAAGGRLLLTSAG